MLEPISDHAKGKGLYFGLRFRGGGPVSQDAREFGDLSDPATIILSLDLNLELHQSDLHEQVYRRTFRLPTLCPANATDNLRAVL